MQYATKGRQLKKQDMKEVSTNQVRFVLLLCIKHESHLIILDVGQSHCGWFRTIWHWTDFVQRSAQSQRHHVESVTKSTEFSIETL